MIFVALLGVVLSTIVSPGDMVQWGWRIPFLIGCLVIPLLFILRSSLQETEEFEQRRSSVPKTEEILLQLGQNWPIVIIGMLLVTMTTVSFYFITAYTPTFGREVLKLSNLDALVALFFMHLRYTTVKLTYVFTAAGLLWLSLLMAFAWSDVITRHPTVPPPPWPANDVTSHMSLFKAQ